MDHINPDEYPWAADEESLASSRNTQPGRGPVSRRRWEDCYNMLALRVFDDVSSVEPNPWCYICRGGRPEGIHLTRCL
eukprot:3116939-Amphidinium_carterae.1